MLTVTFTRGKKAVQPTCLLAENHTEPTRNNFMNSIKHIIIIKGKFEDFLLKIYNNDYIQCIRNIICRKFFKIITERIQIMSRRREPFTEVQEPAAIETPSLKTTLQQTNLRVTTDRSDNPFL